MNDENDNIQKSLKKQSGKKKEKNKLKLFENLYWAIEHYRQNPFQYKHSKETCRLDSWMIWCEDDQLRFHVKCEIEYNCFWRKHNRETLFRHLNSYAWDIKYDDYFDEDNDYFNLNNLFFESDGDIWKTYYEDDIDDLYSLNILFRNFSIRPECNNCCEDMYGPFQSDYDLCNICSCCIFLREINENQNSRGT